MSGREVKFMSAQRTKPRQIGATRMGTHLSVLLNHFNFRCFSFSFLTLVAAIEGKLTHKHTSANESRSPLIRALVEGVESGSKPKQTDRWYGWIHSAWQAPTGPHSIHHTSRTISGFQWAQICMCVDFMQTRGSTMILSVFVCRSLCSHPDASPMANTERGLRPISTSRPSKIQS